MKTAFIDISRHVPINTKEKVDAVVEAYRKARVHPSKSQRKMIHSWITSSELSAYADATFRQKLDFPIYSTNELKNSNDAKRQLIDKTIEDQKKDRTSSVPAKFRELVNKFQYCDSLVQAQQIRRYLKDSKCPKKQIRRIMQEILTEEIFQKMYPAPGVRARKYTSGIVGYNPKAQDPNALYNKYEYGLSDW